MTTDRTIDLDADRGRVPDAAGKAPDAAGEAILPRATSWA